MVKRAKVTTQTYGTKPRVMDKLTGNVPFEEPQKDEGEQGEGERPDTTEQSTKAVAGGLNRTYLPTSFYLSEAQLDKLDQLALDFKRATRRRINRNDIIRALVDEVNLTMLLGLVGKEHP